MASPSPKSPAANPPHEESAPPSNPQSKQDGNDKEATQKESESTTVVVPSNGDWQAIFSPQHNAYYFYNTKTNETTWENPLQPTAALHEQPEASTSSTAGRLPSQYEAAAAAGIDPALAHLDPTLTGGQGGSVAAYAATAKFNARTGRFTAQDARDPTHMSEFERAKRMSEFYFDVDAWQKQRDQEQADADAESKKRKRPTKKDLERFKEQKKQKKIAKTAWLRT